MQKDRDTSSQGTEGRLSIAGMLLLILLVALALWQTRNQPMPDGRVALHHAPERVMGTTCRISVLVGAENRDAAWTAVQDAEAEIRGVEARMSSWLDPSEISRLNSAPPGQNVPLSSSTLLVLRRARSAVQETQGAFDVTCGPLIHLWREAGSVGMVPGPDALQQARDASGWGLLRMGADSAVRLGPGLRIDLGGIAKGYALDRAVARLKGRGIRAGVVDIGGDLICFGTASDKNGWPLDLRNPFGEGTLGRVYSAECAVCTSGNYARFTEIEGKRYSHIIDPRSGMPVDAVPSVTVFAGDACTADIWATALSVLGPAGVARVPPGVEVLMVKGSARDYELLCSSGVFAMLRPPLSGRARLLAPQ